MKKQYKFIGKFSKEDKVSIEETVEFLKAMEHNGKSCSMDFSGVTLYSDTITIDDAYLALTGKTQKEFMDFYKYENVNFLGLWGASIEETIHKLNEYSNQHNILASIDFNGVTLYSDVDTVDSAYIKITGKTKEEIDKAQQERIAEYERKEQEHQNKIPQLTKEWIEKGKEVLDEKHWAYWEEIVPIRLEDLYKGMELGNTLEIVRVLNEGGTFEQAEVKIYDQGHSGTSFHLVCAMVERFSDRGEEFVSFVK